ncbi:4-hydroxybenzoate octaprenyltransferase [Sandaracinobacteroides saxicola]|uniref:4-hydroxybenzoate octaprenyltransferase n=1 Tax=Sandaracinobacteroides saxicola TaxID=2759707 RepID=A0A7G5ILT4_9SPHN|nr:4-hydroxybenzoate octaprenyltransferase [Sandaracinobacteroides saxicola]QMW24326.1 4-hydroxybenzoate octaprenyltransferase [Sandaracinobacteroides saxicola]
MTPDARPGWIDHLPRTAQNYARLARLDRPVGIALLFWPCAMGWTLGGNPALWLLLPWFLLGAAAMRAAGCVYNDIIDRRLDARVARTAARPLASGAISVTSAWAFLIALSLIGLLVLLQLPRPAQIIALGSLALVAAYPFMKRLTWWPQAWLGLTFNWGVPVAWAATNPTLADPLPMLMLYAATLFWTLGYDSLYAVQDLEDDALAGIKSSARALGPNLQRGIVLFYTATILLMAATLYHLRPDPLVLAALLPAALHLAWQAHKARAPDSRTALTLFKSNARAGLLLFLALAVASF